MAARASSLAYQATEGAYVLATLRGGALRACSGHVTRHLCQKQVPEDPTPDYPSEPTSRQSPSAELHKRGGWVDPAPLSSWKRDESEDTGAKASSVKEPETSVSRSLTALIRYRGGPISVAEYMREVLSHPLGGFYTERGDSAIGAQGHFVTSPEISILFGETIAAWVLHQYQTVLGSPEKVAFVELGPGRGTLARQVLTALQMMPGGHKVLDGMHIHFVEASDGLRRMQSDALACRDKKTFTDVGSSTVERLQHFGSRQLAAQSRSSVLTPRRPRVLSSAAAPLREREQARRRPNLGDAVPLATGVPDAARSRLPGILDVTAGGRLVCAEAGLIGRPVSWHDKLSEVPADMPCILIAHEFLDALPLHIFQKDDERGWLEVLVDEHPDPCDVRRFRFVLSPSQTKACHAILGRRLAGLRAAHPSQPEPRAIEVSAEAMAVVEEAALRIEATGGIALFVDYGQDGPYEASLNAIRHHQPLDPLQEPGSADLTAWVDFAASKQAVLEAQAKAQVLGPIQQGHFLLANGMEERLDMLLQARQRGLKEAEALEAGFARLVAGTKDRADGMGETYKAMALAPSGAPGVYPFDLDFSALQR